jgi:hypothetical protein
MSMPSSSDDVATIARSSPRLSRSSITTRCSRAKRTVVGSDELVDDLAGHRVDDARHALLDRQLVELGGARRSASATGVAEDDRRAVGRGSARGSRGRCSARSTSVVRSTPAVAGPVSSTFTSPSVDMSSIGMTTSTSSCLRMPASTIVTGRGAAGFRTSKPPRNSATSSSGRCVADSPMRWIGGFPSVTSSSRSRVSIRWAPRLVVAIAWISSMITVSTPAGSPRRRGEHQVQRLGRRDQQVGRAPDQLLTLVRRRVAGAHPDLGCDESLAEPARPPARCP